MKKIFSIILIVAIIVASMPIIVIESTALSLAIWDGTVANGFYSGNGTEKDPYLITSAEELAYLAKMTNEGNTYSGKKFLICNDIWLNNITEKINNDLTSTQLAQYVKWTPIGDFAGEINGNGHSIYGMVINSAENDQGLFSALVSNGLIKNLHVKNSYVSGVSSVGSIVGKMNTVGNGVFNCSSNAYIKGDSDCGGICGYNNAGYFYACSFSGKINAKKNTGGISGYFKSATMVYCYNKGQINASSYVGGLAGYNNNSQINTSYNAGFVSGDYNVDAIAGKNYYGTSKECYYIQEYCGTSIYTSATKITLDKAKAKDTYSNFNFNKSWAIDELTNDGLPYIRESLYPVFWPNFDSFSNTDNELEYPIFNETEFCYVLKNWLCTNHNIDVRDVDISDSALKEYLNMTIDIPIVDNDNIGYSVQGETKVKDVIAYILFIKNVQAYMTNAMNSITQQIKDGDSSAAYNSFLEYLKNFYSQYYYFQESWNGKDTFNKTLDSLIVISTAIKATKGIDEFKNATKTYTYLTRLYKTKQEETPVLYDDIKYYVLSGGDTRYLNKYYQDELEDLSLLLNNTESVYSIIKSNEEGITGEIIDLTLDNLIYFSEKKDSIYSEYLQNSKEVWDSLSLAMDIVKVVSEGSLIGIMSKSYSLMSDYIDAAKKVFDDAASTEAGWYALSYYYFGKNNPVIIERMFNKDNGQAEFNFDKMVKGFPVDYDDIIERNLAVYFEKKAYKNYTYSPSTDLKLYLWNAADVLAKIENINTAEYKSMLSAYIIAELNLSNNICTDDLQLTVSTNDDTLGSVSGSGKYKFGDTVTLVAREYVNTSFTGWTDVKTGETISTNEAYTFNMYDDYTIRANFSADKVQAADVPRISFQSSDATYYEGEKALALSVDAYVTDIGVLNYTWYRNTKKSTIGSECVGNSNSIIPDTTQKGVFYYYPVVTNTLTTTIGTQNYTTTAVKNGSFIKVTIENAIVVDIEIASEPMQREYYILEDFNPSQLLVNAIYSNGTYSELKDYTIEYDFSQAGNQLVKVMFMNYTKTFNVSVCERSIDDVIVSNIETQILYGDTSTPKPEIKYGLTNEVLEENVDYTLVYSNNDKVGLAEITVNGCGIYKGTKIINFKIICDVHSEVGYRIIEPSTCEKTGAKLKYCLLCDEILSTETIPLEEHAAGNWVTTIDPTCTEVGERVKKCTVCSEILETEEIPANGHVSGEWEVTVLPTCTEIGEQIKKCTVCSEILETKEIPANGHVSGEWEVTIEPTCTLVGEKTKKCTICRAVVEVVEIAATGIHTMGDWEIITNPTNTTMGESAKKCTVCGNKIHSKDIPMLTETSGFCGNDLLWSYDIETKTLTISGTGAMYDYTATTRPWEAFEDEMTTIIIGDEVTYIGRLAFYHSASLANVDMGGVTTIGVSAFSICTGLKNVEIGSSITTINQGAFNGCTALESVIISKSVTTIKNTVFNNCKTLTDVYYEGTREAWNLISIGINNTYLTNAKIHYQNGDGVVFVDEDMHIEGLVYKLNSMLEFENRLGLEGIYIEVYDINGLKLTGDFLVGTGSVVYIYNSKTNELIAIYTVVLYGDVNGDGLINNADQEIITSVATYTGTIDNKWCLTAADVNHDGAVDAFDVIETELQTLDMHNIEQKSKNDYLIKEDEE